MHQGFGNRSSKKSPDEGRILNVRLTRATDGLKVGYEEKEKKDKFKVFGLNTG